MQNNFLFKFSPLGIVILNKQGFIKHINNKACKIFGFNSTYFHNKYWENFVIPSENILLEEKELNKILEMSPIIINNTEDNYELDKKHSIILKILDKNEKTLFIKCTISKFFKQKKIQYLIYLEDVSELQNHIFEKENAIQNLENSLSLVPDIVLEIDSYGYIKKNYKNIKIFNKNFFHNNIFNILNKEDQKKLQQSIELCTKNKKSASKTITIQNKENIEIYDFSISLKHPEQNNQLFLVVLTEVTNKKIYENQILNLNNTLNLVFDCGEISYWDYNLINNKIYFSDKIFEMLGYAKQEFAINKEKIFEIIHPLDFPSYKAAQDNYLNNKENSYQVEYRLLNKDNEWIWFLSKGKIVEYDILNNPTRMMGTLTNIHENKTKAYNLEKQANTDFLTGTYNRYKLNEFLKIEFEKSKRNHNIFSILILDIDYFKKINDTYGHFIGDKILIDFSQKIKKILRPYDIFSRIGGEEFIIFLPNTEHINALVLANRILNTIRNNAFTEDSISISYSVSIGIAFFENDINFEKILVRADKALYLAKNNGRNRIELKSHILGNTYNDNKIS